jgi:hypothetical protein
MAGMDWPIVPKLVSYAKRVELFRRDLDFLSAIDHAQILYKTVQEVWPFGV